MSPSTGCASTPSGAAPALHPTIFEVCERAGLSTEAVFGDQKLVAVMGAAAAGSHWPPDGVLPEHTATDEYGYATDAAVLEHLVPAIGRAPDLLVAHLNDPDTAGHVFGCDTDAARQRYHATDAALGHVVDALRELWDDLVLIVVSDHDHEMIGAPPTDLRTDAAAAGVDTSITEDGSAAVVARRRRGRQRGWPAGPPTPSMSVSRGSSRSTVAGWSGRHRAGGSPRSSSTA